MVVEKGYSPGDVWLRKNVENMVLGSKMVKQYGPGNTYQVHE